MVRERVKISRVRFRVSSVRFRVTVSRSRVSRVMVSRIRFSGPSD